MLLELHFLNSSCVVSLIFRVSFVFFARINADRRVSSFFLNFFDNNINYMPDNLFPYTVIFRLRNQMQIIMFLNPFLHMYGTS